MDGDLDRRQLIINSLETKAVLKHKVYSNTLDVFDMLKEALHEMSSDINEELTTSRIVKIEYRDRGKFEAQMQIASDVLIFTMHTNVFEFCREHSVHTCDYVKNNPNNSYCGVINVYDFLSDSFKHNRTEDDGYLIARIYINHEKCFFVEGKRQEGYSYKIFGDQKITEEILVDIIETSVLYAVDFDLLIPPFDSQKYIGVDQLNTKNEGTKIKTAKRLGFQYNTDDILE
ncbi:MAG: hypothetical protein R3Y26_10660 [Rikenellaceae bacterium]